MILIVLDCIKFKLFVMLLCHMRSSFSMFLLYHAYVYLEFLILACTIYILELDIYHYSDWRAPRVVYREDLDEYWMFLAARANKPHSQTGCVGLCVSKDLKTWEYREPVYFPERFNGACECPDVFRMGDWYYLVFSSYTNLFGTYYVKCPVDGTGWQIPENHRLDARAFYAAKTAGHDMERYICGWNPTKDENIFGFWPDKFKGRDCRTWDWGGSMVVHQLIQQPDGNLGLALP